MSSNADAAPSCIIALVKRSRSFSDRDSATFFEDSVRVSSVVASTLGLLQAIESTATTHSPADRTRFMSAPLAQTEPDDDCLVAVGIHLACRSFNRRPVVAG